MKIDRTFYSFDPVDRTVEIVPRWDVPSICVGDQPLPVDVEFNPLLQERGKGLITRYWHPGDVARCRLCTTCNATAAARRPGLTICHKECPPEVTLAEAALWSERSKD